MTCEDQVNSFEKGARREGRAPGEIFTAYKVTASVDKNEGRFGGTETVGVFFTNAQAVRASKGVDVMGSDGRVEAVDAIMGNDGRAYVRGAEIKIVSDNEVRKAALAKLTDEEKRVLGVRG